MSAPPAPSFAAIRAAAHAAAIEALGPLPVAQELVARLADRIADLTVHHAGGKTPGRLTPDDVREWYRRFGTMHPASTATDACAELRPADAPTPAFEAIAAARRLIADDLNAAGGVR